MTEADGGGGRLPGEGQFMLEPNASAATTRIPAPLSSAASGIGRFSLDTRKRATRASSTKNRTGCWTCRKRHVKCDEAKPACNNCLAWKGSKGKCGGYDPPPGQARSEVPIRRAEPMQLELDLEPELFGSDVEKIYFADWIDVAVHKLSGGVFPSQLWTRTLPQLSRGDKSLRYAAIAIGGLAVMATQETGSPGVDATATFHRSRHYATAVTYYCRALQLQRQAPAADVGSMWAAVLASALFVCFEILRGDRNAALKHVSHSVTLVSKLTAGYKNGLPVREPGSFPSAPGAALVDILRCVERLEVQCRSYISCGPDNAFASSRSSPTKVVTFLTGHPSYTCGTYHHTRRYAGGSLVYNGHDLPDRLSSIDDARGHWEVTQRRAWAIFPVVLSIAEEMQLDLVDSTEREKRIASIADHPRLLSFQRDALRHGSKLLTAFEPLFQSCCQRKHEDPLLYMQCISLRMQHCVVAIHVKTPRCANLVAVKAVTPLYVEINALAEEVLGILSRHQDQGVRAFSMDTGLTWALLMVALGCRDKAVRQNAIRIMGLYPRHDGLWNTRGMLAIAMRSQALEDETAAEGDDKEQWWRMRRREFGYGDDGKTAILRFLKKDAVTGWGLVEEAADYTVVPAVWSSRKVTGTVLLTDIK